MGLFMEMLQSAVANPDVRKFAGRLMATAAQDCAAPNCGAKSMPGVACVVCQKSMCNTHATAFLVAVPPRPLCPPCAMQLWNADADTGDGAAHPPDPPSSINKPRTKKRKRK